MNFKKQLTQIVRFAIGGSIGGGLYYTAYFSTISSVGYIAASILGFITGSSVNFFIQKYWTFENKQKKEAKKQFGYYVTVKGILLFANTGSLMAAKEFLQLEEFMAQVVVAGILTTVSFILTKLIFTKVNPEE